MMTYYYRTFQNKLQYNLCYTNISQTKDNIPLSKKTPAPKQKEERQHQTVQRFQPVIK